ncbi:MAG: monomethylamine:corrinoid methyltransferase [Chloroflexi bacterium]|nr:monomethylamine:corrinoid methyltransferase [Chloroflexota bacterium]
MIPLTEIAERARRGPIMREKDYDIKLSMALRRLVHDYGIKLIHEEIVPNDATTDAVFDAGVDLLAEVGLYNIDTQRVVNFSQEEILKVAEDTSNEQTLGLGQDWVTVRARKPEDKRPPGMPFLIRVPSTEDPFLRMLRSFSDKDSESGRLATALLASLESAANIAHAPGEIIWEIARARWKKDEARRIGRPDMYLGIPNATSVGAILAAFTAKHAFRPATGMVPLQIMPELKIDWDRLRLAVACEEMGGVPWVSAMTILGAYCRGPEEAAIMLVANVLGQLAYSHGSIASLRAQMARGKDTAVDACAAATRALTKRTHIPMADQARVTIGDLEGSLYAAAAGAVAAVASGASWDRAQPCLAAPEGGLSTSLPTKVLGGVFRSVAGLKRDEALDLFNKIESRYVDRLDPLLVGTAEIPKGSDTGPPCYQLDNFIPTKEYLAIYNQVKADLETLGICYDDEETGTFEKLTARDWSDPPGGGS